MKGTERKSTAGDITKSMAGDITKPALGIMLLSVLSKGLGMVRESFLAARFGTSFEADAYKTAFEMPSTVLTLVSTAIATTFIPVYTDYEKNKTKEQAWRFVNNMLGIVLAVSALLVLAGIVSARALVGIAAPGFSGPVYNLTVRLTILILPSLIFLALAELSSGYLHCKGKFAVTAFIWIPFNLIITGAMVFFPDAGIEAVAAASAMAVASRFFVQVPAILKTGYSIRPVIDLAEPGLKRVFFLSLPVLISGAFEQAYLFIGRMLASGLDEGSISALDYAGKINELVFNIFLVSIITVVYPSLSLASGDADRFRNFVSRVIRIIIYISLPATAGLFILRAPVTGILFERGRFNSGSTQVTSLALGCYSTGIIGLGAKIFLDRVFYSLRDSRTPMVNGIITVCINAVLSLILVKAWGVGGLAAASSFSVTAGAVMLFIRLRRRIGCVNEKEIGVSVLKSAAASFVMCVSICFSRSCMGFVTHSPLLAVKAVGLLVSIGAGAVAYAITLLLLRAEEMQYAFNLAKERIGKMIIMRRGGHWPSGF
jgi:putative peptidoglycan lipid II flippase